MGYRYNDPGSVDDWGTVLAVDEIRSVYVVGGSFGSGTGLDYTTIKYNPSGAEEWVARHNNPTDGDDQAAALALDGSGNVYVTGYSYSAETGHEYATIKYDATGAEEWVARYNGTGNDFYDEAYALAVDGSGNVYVTGSSYGPGIYSDYATIKYNASGVEEWVARYHGSGNDNESAFALALDGTGNVYVTGASSGSGDGYDVATIKYDASGAEGWVSRYNGPGSSDDQVQALTVDERGNIYVTGYSYSSETFNDYATVKYDSSGEQVWVARYDGPGNEYDQAGALCVDGSGNVYVTGSSSGSAATIKYDSSGEEVWVARYGPGYAVALAVDENGNVFVTGSSSGSDAGLDYITIRYDASGEEVWVARYDGPWNGDDHATALAVDASGNVYVTGDSYVEVSPSGGFTDFATIKYNATGEEEWVARYDALYGADDKATSIAIDLRGNVYVTGYSYGGMIGYDYTTIKYDASGEEEWAVQYNGPGNNYDLANGLALDEGGNVYVTGYSVGSGTDRDYATIKYDSSGVEEWVARYNYSGDSFDEPSALALDGSGSVYVTGTADGHFATVKYDVYGVEEWVAGYGGAGNYDEARAFSVGKNGNVYVTGSSLLGSNRSYTTIKYIQYPTHVSNEEEIPTEFSLFQNYPNPFNPSTTIRYSIPRSGEVSLRIFNLLGEEVATLVTGIREAGTHTVQWDATGQPSGVYFYRLQAGDFAQTRKLVLLR